MKFKIQVKNTKTGKMHWETYDEDTQNPQDWAERTLEFFNNTLRPHESARELMHVVVIDTCDDHHKWNKQTNGMSVLFHGSVVDLVRCERCFITGKRYGFTQTVKIDSKYRKKVFKTCTKETKNEAVKIGW